MSDKICPECGKDLAETQTDPVKHAVRHWGALDVYKKSQSANPDALKRIAILEGMK